MIFTVIAGIFASIVALAPFWLPLVLPLLPALGVTVLSSRIGQTLVLILAILAAVYCALAYGEIRGWNKHKDAVALADKKAAKRANDGAEKVQACIDNGRRWLQGTGKCIQ